MPEDHDHPVADGRRRIEERSVKDAVRAYLETTAELVAAGKAATESERSRVQAANRQNGARTRLRSQVRRARPKVRRATFQVEVDGRAHVLTVDDDTDVVALDPLETLEIEEVTDG